MDVREKQSSKKRLVDADKLLTNVVAVSNSIGKVTWSAVSAIDILTAPTIDAVQVVRCRECKQGEVDDPDFPDQYYCHAGCGWNNGNFYCAYGERKEGAD